MDLEQIFINGTYFETYPDKILGVEIDSTNQFGQSIIKVKGDISEINKIDVPEVVKFPFVIDENTILEQNKDQKNIENAIKETESTFKAPAVETLFSFDEVLQKYNPGISKEDIMIWAWYQAGKLFDKKYISDPENGFSKYYLEVLEKEQTYIDEWTRKGLIVFNGAKYIPANIFYSGNIYQKLNQIKTNKDKIVSEIGEVAYDKQVKLLEESIPEKLKLDGPQSERLIISPLDKFTEEYKISKYADGTPFIDEVSLIEAFRSFIEELPREDFKNGSNAFDIRNHFLDKTNYSRGTDKAEKAARDRKSQQDGHALFQRFLNEMVAPDDQRKIEFIWNSTYNNWKDFDYSKIPVVFQFNKYFKNSGLEMREAQREGVSFLSSIGSGIIAYDVGVGKTMTAIMAMGQALYTGQAKRPLVVVPNPTYKKWITETVGAKDDKGNVTIHGIIPQYEINDFYNLGVNVIDKVKDKAIKDNSITFITYEGLLKLGFGQQVQDEMSDKLFDILSQGGLSARDFQKLKEQIDQTIGTVTADTELNFEDFGFDYIVVDEAHNAKKVFTKVAGEVNEKGEREQKKYQIDAGTPSTLGLKTFMFSQYITERHNGANVCLLTATPFTNSPLEVYSMLALVGYKTLKQRGISSINDFFDKFVNETYELKVTHRGSIEQAAVIKSFNNRIVLQSIIYQFINYKSGEEAKIPRPIKVVLPLYKDENGITLPLNEQVDTTLPPTEVQKYWLKEIQKFANKVNNSFENYILSEDIDAGRDLRAISYGKAVTLSPYLFKIDSWSAMENEPSPEEYIESSPKLKYVMECIASVREYHKQNNEAISGQIIYMDLGTDYFPLIKDYLVQQIGYASNEVEMIYGGISNQKKETIKENFLAGKVKIIIGSSTIKEGIDLQNKTTTLYNCSLDWNPTDVQQLEGRLWRYGNMFSHVRIVNPLLENSMDSFIFQKLEEKTSRINDIWFRNGRGNVLDIDSFDAKELKLALITDPREKAKQDIKMRYEVKLQERNVFQGYAKDLSNAKYEINRFRGQIQEIERYFEQALKFYVDKLEREKVQLIDLKNTLSKTELTKKENSILSLEKFVTGDKEDIKYKLRLVKNYANDQGYWFLINTTNTYINNARNIERLEKNILQRANYTIDDDFTPLIQEYEQKASEINQEMEGLKSDEYITSLTAEYEAEQMERDSKSKGIDARVDEFKKLNHLLSCLDKVHYCELNNPKIIPIQPKVDKKMEPTNEQRIKIAIVKLRMAALKLKLNIAA